MLDISVSGSHDDVWVEYSEGVKFRIRPAQNLDFQRRMNALMRPHRRAIDNKTLDPSVMMSITITAISETVLIDWSGVGTASQEVPYSPEQGAKMLRNHPAIREFIQERSLDLETFAVQHENELGKL